MICVHDSNAQNQLPEATPTPLAILLQEAEQRRLLLFRLAWGVSKSSLKIHKR